MQKNSSLLNNTFHNQVEDLIKMIESQTGSWEEKAGYLEFLEENLNSPILKDGFSKVARRVIWYYRYLSKHYPMIDGVTEEEMFLYDTIHFYWFEDFTLVIHQDREPVWEGDFPYSTGYKDGKVKKVLLFWGEKNEYKMDLLFAN